MKSLLLLACVFTCCLCHAQSASWFEGTWYGETYFPNGPITKRIAVRLKVTEVNGNQFTAQFANMYPNDTTVRLERVLTGYITGNSMSIISSEETYIRDLRTRNFWSDCTQCPMQSYFNKQENEVTITIITSNCGDVCDGETVFRRSLITFDSSEQEQLAKVFGTKKHVTVDTITKTTDSIPIPVAKTIANPMQTGTVTTKSIPEKTALSAANLPVIKDTMQQAVIVETPVQDSVATSAAALAKDSLYAAFTQRASNLFHTYSVTSPHIVIQLFDNAQIDGDVVSVFHNNQLMIDHQTLTHKAITFAVTASDENKHHEFVMVADNLGLLPPNTALLRIIAGKEKYELEVSSDMFSNAKIAIDYTGE